MGLTLVIWDYPFLRENGDYESMQMGMHVEWTTVPERRFVGLWLGDTITKEMS